MRIEVVRNERVVSIDPERLPSISPSTRIILATFVKNVDAIDYDLRGKAIELGTGKAEKVSKETSPSSKLSSIFRLALAVGVIAAAILLSVWLGPVIPSIVPKVAAVASSIWIGLSIYNTIKADLVNPFDQPLKFVALMFFAGPFLPIYELFKKQTVASAGEELKKEVQNNYTKYESFFRRPEVQKLKATFLEKNVADQAFIELDAAVEYFSRNS